MRLLALFLTACHVLLAVTPIEDKTTVKILTPELASLKTAKIRLDNGLEVVLVSDPGTEQSGAVLDVQAGSWQDPKDHPGIAHFLEHMLFLGTEKYPVESEYSKYITEHGGQHNAYTANTYTAYMFDINNEAFPEALDRFAQFFISPLFNPSGVNRELHSIDQEFGQNMNNEYMRQYFVIKELSKKDHPQYNFNIGNTSTLANTSQEVLKKWYQDHYSANLMRLYVYSSLPLDALQDLVVKTFSAVPNRQLPMPNYDEAIIDPQYFGTLTSFTPLHHIQTLGLVWVISGPLAHDLDSKPEDTLCSILGYQGPGSLYQNLKEANLADDVHCGASRISPNHLIFQIEISATDEGIQKKNDIIRKVFEMLELIKTSDLPEPLLNELNRIGTLRLAYQGRKDVFSKMIEAADWLNDESVETFPERSQLLFKPDAKRTKEFISLLKPSTMLVFEAANEDKTGLKHSQKERWFGTPFITNPLSKEFLDSLNNIVPTGLALPKANDFIPPSIEEIAQPEAFVSLPHPQNIAQDNTGTLYIQEDKIYAQPKASWIVTFKTPLLDPGKANQAVLGDLYVKALEDILSSIAFDAKMADLEYYIEYKPEGLRLTISGYSWSVKRFYYAFLEALHQDITEERFSVIKEVLLREYQTFFKKNPYVQALDLVKDALYEYYTPYTQRLNILPKLTYEKYKKWSRNLFKKTYTQAMLYGGIDRSSAFAFWRNTNNKLQSAPYPKEEQLPVNIIDLPAKRGPFYLEERTQAKGNAVVLTLEASGYSAMNRSAQQILSYSLKEAFYDALRTKQQTGYIVASESQDLKRHLFTYFIVQSNSHGVSELLQRFELFIESYLNDFRIDKETFETLKLALLTQLKERPKNPADMSELLNSLAFEFDGDFDWIDKRIEATQALTYEEFLTFTQDLLSRKNRRRLAILLKGQVQKDQMFLYSPLKNLQQLHSFSKFKPT